MSSTTIDLLIRIKNGYMAHREQISGIYSKLNENVLIILKEKNYISDFKVEENGNKKSFLIDLLYINKKPVLTDVKLISKPGQRIYRNKSAITSVRGRMGIGIISTSKGLMTDKEAREGKIGGELICEVW